MKMIKFGNIYYEILGEFYYPVNSYSKSGNIEYVIKHNDSILYFRPSLHIIKQYYTIDELSNLIKETKTEKWRNPLIKDKKLEHLNNIKIFMRDNVISEVLKEETIWKYA